MQTNAEYQGEIVATKVINGIKVHINDKYIRGKTRRQCLEEVNRGGMFELKYVGSESMDTPYEGGKII